MKKTEELKTGGRKMKSRFNQIKKLFFISVLFFGGILPSCRSNNDRMDRTHIRERGTVHIQLKGLDAESRYELRTYIGTMDPAPGNYSADIFWGRQRPRQELQAYYRVISGNRPILSDILPCPIPDVIKTGGQRRSWRTGRELMEKGLDIDTILSGRVVWITYNKMESSSTQVESRRIILDGEWKIVTDSGDKGRDSGWHISTGYPVSGSKPIQVPGNVNEVFPDYNGVVWYLKTFVNNLPVADDIQSILRFKACSYICDGWLNGTFIGSHEGGEAPFEFNVTKQLVTGENTVILRVFFPKGTILNGGSEGPCNYPVFWGMGGLTQGVELVSKPLVRIGDVFVRSDWKTGEISFETTVINSTDKITNVKLRAEYCEHKTGKQLGTLSSIVEAPPGESVHIMNTVIKPFHLWNLEDPFLYSVVVQAGWNNKTDIYNVPHFGFRDLRVNKNGYFELNGKRIFLKSIHSNVVDPVCLEGTPRDMTWLGIDFELLKAAGFNMFREIAYSALPEQLDIADELGFLIYNEHQASWLMKVSSKFGTDLPGVVRRDRNHPSLVIWGMLNEVGYLWAKKDIDSIYQAARSFLPRLRAIDNTRLVLLSSGRFDRDFKTGSASNPGSSSWNVYLGGEDPVNPIPTGNLIDGAPYQVGAGDVHIYESHPIRWEFIESMRNIAEGTRPIFVSEGGQASACNSIASNRNMLRVQPSGKNIMLTDWIEPAVRDLEAIWTKYRLYNIYPNIEDMLVASQKMAATQRAIFFNVIRSNPGINGYSLTSLTDLGAGEGIMDDFRHFKSGYYNVISDGWAKLRWCLFVNHLNSYAGQNLRIRVSLANEDILPEGNYPARIAVSGPGGTRWEKDVTVKIHGGENPPLAYTVFDEDIKIDGLVESQYTLSAKLLNRPDTRSDSLRFNITDPGNHPDLRGFELTVLGVSPEVRKLLTGAGIAMREYVERESYEHEVILVGDGFKEGEAEWRMLYDRISKGAFAIFLSRQVLSDAKGINKWIDVELKGTQTGGNGEPNIFRSDIVAFDHPVFSGLPKGVLIPLIYENLLRPKARFSDITLPDDIAAVWIKGTVKNEAGLVIGIYNHQKGKFLINSFDLIGNIGQPAADRMILNMVKYGQKYEEASK
jgi:hypothetical protein